LTSGPAWLKEIGGVSGVCVPAPKGLKRELERRGERKLSNMRRLKGGGEERTGKPFSR